MKLDYVESIKQIKGVKIIFVITFLLFFIWKLMLAFNPHVVFWDESVYIGMGKYLYSDGTIGLWEDLRPIFLPLILGALWEFGAAISTMEIVMLLFSAAFVICTYFLAK